MYKDNNEDDTMGSKLVSSYFVAIISGGASERYVHSRDRVTEGRGERKTTKAMIEEKLHTLA